MTSHMWVVCPDLGVSVMAAPVHVCWWTRSADASRIDWLDATERRRFGRLQRVEDRRQFLTSRVLLKTVVGHLADAPPALVRLSYDCPQCRMPHGRPVVFEPSAAARWHVSISHTGRHVMVAATDAGPVGVDVEQAAATGFDGFDDVALTSAERTEVAHCAPASQARARAVYWARKEAVLKATGRGLAVDPCALEVSAPHLPAALTAWRADDPPSGPLQILDVPVDTDHVAAVAVLARTPCEVVLQRASGPSWGTSGSG
jgi:4'-phosphopantetheinyl transferase